MHAGSYGRRMARYARKDCGGELIHATSRGNNQRAIFKHDCDYRELLLHFTIVARTYELTVYAYCVMGNHYHFVLAGFMDAISDAMRELNGGHARRMNRRYGRRNHQFGDRFTSTVIESDSHLLNAIGYTVTNPERTKDPVPAETYRWSSYRPCAGLIIAPPFLAVREVHGLLGAEGDRGAALFREWIAGPRRQVAGTRP